MFRLIVNPGTGQEWEIPLSPGAITLGSGPASDFPIAHETVSAAHCEIVVADGAVTVKDLGSSCGTFVDHAPVTESAVMPGQTVTLGEVELRLDSDDAPGVTATASPPLPPRLPAQIQAGPTESLQPAAHCKYHPKSAAIWTCHHCHTFLCDLCVTMRRTTESTRFCRKCGNECIPVLMRPTEVVKRNFFELLPGVFGYPFKGNGVILLVAGTILFPLLRFVASLGARVLGPYGGILILAVGILITGYIFSYAKCIITSTVEGDASPPDWPDFSGWEDVAMPCGQLIALLVLSFGPAIAFRWWHPFGAAYAEPVRIAATVLGALLAPMGMLALAMFDSIGTLNPVALVWSIFRIPVEYLLAAAAFEMVVGAYFLINRFGSLFPVPVLSGLLSGFVNLYLMTAGMRILGLLYLTQKEKLGWFNRSPGL